MEYQMSVPLNLSDPWLAEWSQPVTIVRSTQGPQPHSWVWEDPAGAWENPANPGQWLFIGQTTVGTGVLLTTWASREGSNWTAGFDYVGSFFPGTGDARCPGAGCGGCCPSFANGRTFSSNTSASHLLYTCSNQYWLGSYQPSTGSSSTGAQAFVPGGVPQTFDAGGQAMASKGFWAPDGRYLHFTWVIGTDDHAVASRRNPGSAGTWDSMLSVPRELTVDEELDTAILTPAQEVTALRSELLYSNASTTPIPRGVFPLPGAHGDALDIEVNFTWEGNVAAGSVAGVQVLTGPGEATTVYTLAPTLASATLVANLTDASTFRPIPMDPYMPGMDLSGGDYNSTRVPPNSDPHDCQRRCEADPNCAAWTQVIRGEPVGAADCIKKGPNHLPPSPLAQCTSGCVRNCNRTAFGPQDPIIMSNFSLRVAEAVLQLRILVDRSVVEAYAQGGRGQLITRVYPNYNATAGSNRGVSLVYDRPIGCAYDPTVSIKVWSMGQGNVPGSPPQP